MRAIRGFTLLELLIVISLVVVAMAIAASVIGSALPGQQLRGAAKDIVGQLRYVRAQAIATGKPQVFTLDANTREWKAAGRSGVLPKSVEIIATVARSEQPADGVAAIRFFPEGASTGGRVLLKNGRAQWQVDVGWLIGEVKLKRVEGQR